MRELKQAKLREQQETAEADETLDLLENRTMRGGGGGGAVGRSFVARSAGGAGAGSDAAGGQMNVSCCSSRHVGIEQCVLMIW